MQKQESGKSNLKFSDLKVTEGNSMGRKHRKSFIAPWLIAAVLLTSASAQEAKRNGPEQASTPETP